MMPKTPDNKLNKLQDSPRLGWYVILPK